eukprot:Rmarinus@m.2535
MGKASRSQGRSKQLRHNPLHADLSIEESSEAIKFQKRQKKRAYVEQMKDKSNGDERFISGKMSQKILEEAQKQRDEVEEDSKFRMDAMNDMRDTESLGSLDDEVDVLEVPNDDLADFSYLDETKITEEDEAALRMFMPSEAQHTRTLADVIMQKLQEVEKGNVEVSVQDAVAKSTSMQPEAIQLFRDIGKYLKRYRSGKLPKAFKVIPSLRNWEEVVLMTEPTGWSAQAWYAATNLFASNLNDKMAQRYYNLALLPKVRSDIADNKKTELPLIPGCEEGTLQTRCLVQRFLTPFV